MGRTTRWVLIGIVVALLAACTGGTGTHDAASTTTTSSPAPEWLRHAVARQSRVADGPKHGTAWMVSYSHRTEAVAAVSDDRVVNVADPPVYVVVLRGTFTSDHGAMDGRPFRGRQLTLVLPQDPDDPMNVYDTGIGPESPPPTGSERFTF